MHVVSITAAFLASAFLSSATPTGTSNLVPRACTTVFPTFIDHIGSQTPGTTLNDMNVVVGLDSVSGTLYNRDVLVRFDGIPAGSYGCQLDVTFPPATVITNTGATQVNVFTLSRLAVATDTYTSAPTNVDLFGTITFASDPVVQTTRVINSGVCAPSLSYRLTMGSTTNPGSVSFAEVATTQGLRITYNC